MPPKKANHNNKAAGGKKKKDVEDDFEALLAQAKETNAKVAEANQKEAEKKKQQQLDALPRSMAADEKPVPSSADHPENPYPKSAPHRQTWPEPTIPVRKLYTTKNRKLPYFDHGVESEYVLEDHTHRFTSEELRRVESSTMEGRLNDLRESAEVHRQVRRWAMSWIKPGLPLMLICDRIEKKLEELIGKDGTNRGQAFPTGCSLNHIAAHYTPNTGDEKVVLDYNDVMKVDFGTHVNGNIIDCAWTVTFDPVYDPLVSASREATLEGVRQAGIDVRLCDVGAAIQEVMESYEMEMNGKTLPVRSIQNLSGHNINPYVIHGGKSVPLVRGGEQTKMEEGELFAIETFGSTGKAVVREEGDCSHYALQEGMENATVRSDKAQQLLKHINKTYGTLPFCRKWLDRQGQDRHLLSLNHLVEHGVVNKYPPLCDVKGSYVSQMEHTLILRPTCKEVLSMGDDY